jgi:OmcA/MtrC family decaheme c-type cytochrome
VSSPFREKVDVMLDNKPLFRTAARLACALAIIAGAATLMSTSRLPYTARDKAYYADAATVAFVRPGLVFSISSVNIASDGTVTARLKITDPRGLPLDREGITTPGSVSSSFVIARIPKGGRFYQAYTTRVKRSTYPPTAGQTAKQASSDSGGRYVKIADGEYDYVFGTKLPANYEKNATHTVGVYGSRNLSEFDMGTNYDSTIYTFVPDGSQPVEIRDVINDQSCNACHDEINFHGGSRRGLPTCILCHAPAYEDVVNTNPETGNTIDMRVMIHKIHMGSLLPSVQAGKPYQIVGFGNTITDYSHVTLPSEANNCSKCHETSATQSDTYLTTPNREACGACHDDVNFATGENHAGVIQVNDNSCSRCHIPQGEMDFDVSIKGAHIDPTESSLISGVVADITSVESTGAGQRPVVNFTVKDRSGRALELSALNRIAFTLAGPTTDYGEGIPGTRAGYVTESATGATATGGGFRYTFTQPVPANAKGTYSISLEARRQETVLAGTLQQRVIQTGSPNETVYFSADGSAVQPRRQIVDLKRCNDCHRSLSLHGENRNVTEYCVVCHNPRETDVSRRPAAQAPAESIDFALMIHRIHAGDLQSRDYTIYGFGNTPHNYNLVRFPGEIANCTNCHLAGTFTVPVDAVLDKSDPRGFLNPVKPASGACLGCHTSLDAASHALANTSALGESCGACHGEGKDASVSRVHSQ